MAGLGGLTNGLGGGGGGPLGAASNLAGGGGPLGAASNLTGGGGPLGAASNLTGGLPGGGDGGGGPLDGVTGLASGLTGGGQGLNLLNLVGIGSDDDALLNLNPAEHKKIKAAKEAQARQNQKKRDAAMRQMQDQIQKQGGMPTPEQEKFMQDLRESEVKDKKDLERAEQILGPTDPEELRKATAECDAAEAARASQRAQNTASTSTGPAAKSGSGAQPGGPSDGLFYAYLVDSNTHTPTHTLAFANAAAADDWFRQASATSSVQRVSPQMYMYSGAAPRPSGRMACMPDTSSAPILPLQRADGYPICCKSGPPTAGALANPVTSTNPYAQQAAAPPLSPPRKKFTFNDAAKAQAQKARENGDSRPLAEIYQETMRDLKEDCPKQSGGATSSAQTAPGTASSEANGYAPGAANGTASNNFATAPSNTMANGTAAAPTNSIQPSDDNSGIDALNALGLGGLTSGLLGSGPGLNVAGILAIGSDQDAAIHLSPAERREDKMKKAKMLQDQQKTQQRQMAALQEQIKNQPGGKPTPQQERAMRELDDRGKAIQQSNEKLREGAKKDELEMQQNGGGAPPGGPLGGATSAVPANLPAAPAVPALGGGAPALPAVPALGGGGGALPGGIGL